MGSVQEVAILRVQGIAMEQEKNVSLRHSLGVDAYIISHDGLYRTLIGAVDYLLMFDEMTRSRGLQLIINREELLRIMFRRWYP